MEEERKSLAFLEIEPWKINKYSEIWHSKYWVQKEQ